MSSQYSAIAAKLKAMYAKSLSNSELAQLTEKRTVGEICSYLKSTDAYGDVLESVDESNAHRGEIELHMQDRLTEDFFRIYKFTDKRFLSIMDFVFTRREIEFLKDEIHHIYTNKEIELNGLNASKFENFFKNHTKINREIIKNAKNLDDCAAACKNTKYAEPLQRAANLNSDFFSAGMLLDGYYFKLAWKNIHSKIPKSQVNGVEKIIGSMVDMLNLMWIYRGKKYFDFSNEMIFTYILNIQYRLTQDMLKKLVNTETVDSFIEMVKKTPYAELFDKVNEGVFPEENYRYMVYRNAKILFQLETESLAAIVAYDQLKSYEIWRITTVIEGVRYSMSPDQIKAHINLEI